MRGHARRQFQPVGQFHRDDLLRVIAQHDMDFMLARIQIIEQPLRVKRAGGSGDGDKNFHCCRKSCRNFFRQTSRAEGKRIKTPGTVTNLGF